MEDREYRVCNRCVMDTTAEDITFNEDGHCNFCTGYLERSGTIVFRAKDEREILKEVFVRKVKESGRGKKYDCVMGLSGGVDSSWALYQAVECGLRPLAVHMDNGWNSELAQSNIENLVKRLGVDLYTHVIDWPEYKSLMQAFFDADVIDVELLYDNAMKAVNFNQAGKYGAKFILSGENRSTEGMVMPEGWNWFKHDKKNIKSIYRKHGNNKPIKTFPYYGLKEHIYYCHIKNIEWMAFLDFFDYRKEDAQEILCKELSYKPYPYKHYESVFTRFYQGYILPEKFNVDKRRLHLSTLIMSDQMTRNEALLHLQEPAYGSDKLLQEDKVYFMKKMRWDEKQLNDYLERTPIPHDRYGTEKQLFSKVNKYIKKVKRKVKSRKSWV